ncbi:tetratricopeptide repeat protein [Larkinella soli]|uniref:tetratricopeptide repeat protein n=1 Tax=Larkinella soli TaxID=1770527 RepID=UPI000FFC45BB|nr:hypothetical protein [Larkinella soli]
MELSDELLEQMGAYLSGRMTAPEKAAFEDRLRTDSALRDEVAVQREIKEGLTRIAQKERFRQMHADLEKRGLLDPIAAGTAPPAGEEPAPGEGRVLPMPGRSRVFGRDWTYFAAAAVLLLVVSLGWLMFRNWDENRLRASRNEQLFTAYFSPRPKVRPPVVNDPDRVAAPAGADQAARDSVRLERAVSLLRGPQPVAAAEALRPLAEGTPGHWTAGAQWYLALAYLKAGRRNEALPVLERIAGLNGHPYQREARRLLNDLQNEE